MKYFLLFLAFAHGELIANRIKGPKKRDTPRTLWGISYDGEIFENIQEKKLEEQPLNFVPIARKNKNWGNTPQIEF